jgi:type I restriction enzyme S subunit
LGELLTENSRNGLGARPSDEPPGVPILRISAGTSRRDGGVAENDFKYLIVSRKELQTYRLRPGDLLACRFNGNLHYVGRFSIYKHENGEDRIYPDKLIRFRIDSTKALPEFVVYSMNSPTGRAAIESFCTTTAGNIGISAGELKTIPVAVPSIAEQQRVVDYLKTLQNRLASASEAAATTQAELNVLLSAILDRAFRGEL